MKIGKPISIKLKRKTMAKDDDLNVASELMRLLKGKPKKKIKKKKQTEEKK